VAHVPTSGQEAVKHSNTSQHPAFATHCKIDRKFNPHAASQ
jgi:hypothetical protein